MAIDRPRRRPPFWQRLSPTEQVIAAGLAAIALAGVALIGNGLYIKAKASLSQVLLERSFRQNLAGIEGARPWPWADFVTEARIDAPRIGRSAIVLSGANGETLAFGPAWLSHTPQPGDEGTAVIAAHRDTHFRWLKDVRPGDTIEITRRDGQHLAFRALGGRIARWDQSGIDPEAHGRNLALSTCWPFDAGEPGPLRYILDAELIGATQSVATNAERPPLKTVAKAL